MEIRETGTGDLELLQDLLQRVWHATYDATMGAERVREITRQWHSLDALAREVASPEDCSLVALEGEKLIGHALARDAGGGLVKLSRLYVDPAAQRGGIGRALFSVLLDRHEDAMAFELEVEEANEKARAFYEKQGFSILRRESNCGDQDGIPTLILRRER